MKKWTEPKYSYRGVTPRQHKVIVEKLRSIRIQKMLAKDAGVPDMNGKASIKEDNAPLGENVFIHKGLS